jgi:hypothetical protein
MDYESVTLREFLELRLDAQDRVLAQILREAQATNGRVRALESKVAVLEERSPAGPLKAGSLGAAAAGVVWFLWEKLGK